MSALSEIGAAALRGRKRALMEYGDQLLFYARALAWTPRAVRRHKREILSILAEVAFGRGALSMIAGTVTSRDTSSTGK